MVNPFIRRVTPVSLLVCHCCTLCRMVKQVTVHVNKVFRVERFEHIRAEVLLNR